MLVAIGIGMGNLGEGLSSGRSPATAKVALYTPSAATEHFRLIAQKSELCSSSPIRSELQVMYLPTC